MPVDQVTTIGNNKIIGQLGNSSVSVVYKAEDRLGRIVAIKMLLPNRVLSSEFLDSFRDAVKILAGLSHTNILKVLDFGIHNDAPYLVMDYMPGGSLEKFLGNPMQWEEAFKLILPALKALVYAHGKNIIHRDLKPSNILLNRNGEPLITDFSVNTLIEAAETRDQTSTTVGMGNPEYMSPEQGKGMPLDHRADIYSMGIILYELITGSKPFTAGTAMEMVIQQVTADIPRPSKTIPSMPLSVEKILIKSLKKKPEERYQTIQELIDDIESLIYEKKVIRGKLFIPGAILGITVLIGLIAVSIFQFHKGSDLITPTGVFLPSTPTRASRSTELIKGQSTASPAAQTIVPTVWSTEIPKKEPPANYPAIFEQVDLPVEPISIENVENLKELIRLGSGHPETALWSSDGTKIIRGSTTGIYFYHPAGLVLSAFTAASGWVTAIDLSPDEELIAAGYRDGSLRVWDASTFQLIWTVKNNEKEISSVEFSPDGSRIITSSGEKIALIQDSATGAVQNKLEGHLLGINSAQFSPDGKLILTGSNDFKIIIWDANTGLKIRELNNQAAVLDMAISPDNNSVAAGLNNASIKLWNLENGKLVGTFMEIKLVTEVNSISFSPDGSKLASGSNDGMLRIWNLKNKKVLWKMPASDLSMDGVIKVQYSPDGKTLLTHTQGNRLRTWETDNDKMIDSNSLDGESINRIIVSPDRNYFAVQATDQRIWLWDSAQKRIIKTIQGTLPRGQPFFKNSKSLIYQGADNLLHVVRVTGETPPLKLSGFDSGGFVQTLLDDRVIAAASIGKIMLWSADSGFELKFSENQWLNQCQVALDDSSAWIGAGSKVGIFDTREAAESLCDMKIHPRGLGMDFAEDGKWYAFGRDDKTITLYGLQVQGEKPVDLEGHTGKVYDVDFSADQNIMASGGENAELFLWDLGTTSILTKLPGATGTIYDLEFSADGTLLLAASADGSLHIYGIVE